MAQNFRERLDELDGAVKALGLAVLALVDVLPAETKASALKHIDAALDGGKVGLMNSTASEAEIEGFDAQVAVLRGCR